MCNMCWVVQKEEMSEVLSWKSLVSVQLESVAKEHAHLRFVLYMHYISYCVVV